MKHMRPSLQSSSQPLKPSLPPLPKIQQLQVCKPICKFSRRELAICIGSSCPFLQITHPFHLSKALAAEDPEKIPEEKPNPQEPNPNTTSTTTTTTTTTTDASDVKETSKKMAFLDISIDGMQVGRIKIELNESQAPSGTTRFSNLVTGRAGISYRRKEFVKIMPSYIQHGGVRSFGVDAEVAKNTGNNLGVLDELVSELERSNEKVPGTKNIAGSVGIVVRDPLKPPPKLKLVARRGKLEIDEEEVGSDPNGTEFVISTRDCPELDASTLVIGRVVEGMDVVEKIGKVKTVQENSSSPYFRVAKLIGDKRAIVAERGFNRPYSKIVVTKCGLFN